MQDTAVRPFSPLDQQTLRLLGQGLSSKEIARHEGRSWRTVDARIARMRERIGAGSRVELVALAWRLGLV